MKVMNIRILVMLILANSHGILNFNTYGRNFGSKYQTLTGKHRFARSESDVHHYGQIKYKATKSKLNNHDYEDEEEDNIIGNVLSSSSHDEYDNNYSDVDF